MSGFPRLCLRTAYHACFAIALPLFKLDMQISRIQLSSPVLVGEFLGKSLALSLALQLSFCLFRRSFRDSMAVSYSVLGSFLPISSDAL